MPEAAVKELSVRAIRPGDVEAIVQIDAEISGEKKAGFWRGMLGAYLADPAEHGQGASDLAPDLCQVAELQGRVVGFMVGDIQSYQFGIPRCGRIVTIGVHPEFRRHDIGTRLIQAMFDVFDKFRVPVIQCLVRPADPLHSFFRANGFEETEFFAMERRTG
ncbi:MAG TPA: GNAT family N-acetyltransferase [Candidatus Udaeobacter sp.]|nr:GNAT family N-acetyltransferase [Candidatus Udaeobacter sp.]